LIREADITGAAPARSGNRSGSSGGEVMSGDEAARVNMIERQLQPSKVTDRRVIDAFAVIRRELFVPERLRAVAYTDDDLPLGNGRYLMAPMVAARLLQAVEARRNDAALVVGAGVCYEAALLSMLCRSVVALESDAALARQGRAALVEHRIASVTVVEDAKAPGTRTRPAYDVILFAGAVAELPAEIAAQLAEGGRMVAVIKPDDGPGRATLTTRTGGVLASRVMFDAATPLLPGHARKPAFVF
jgi:protein-L-isoaspartate(D-aspartate) O-methyltransferase